MSLGVNMRAQAITTRLTAERLDGLLDICCSNASYLVRVDPDVLHPRRRRAPPRARAGGRRRGRVPAPDAGRGGADPVGGRVDAQSAHALPRPPPDAGQDRHRVRRRAQRLRHRRRVQGVGLLDAVHGHHDRVRPRAGVVVSAHHPRQADRGPQVRAAAHRYPGASLQLGRCLRRDLSGPGSRRLPAARDVRHPAGRPVPAPAGLPRGRLVLRGRRPRRVHAGRPAPATTRSAPRSRPSASPTARPRSSSSPASSWPTPRP